MVHRRTLILLGAVAALSFANVPAMHADTLTQITSSTAQAADDTLALIQKRSDGTVLAASFTAATAKANSVTVSMGAANSIISVVCTANPCSWTGTGFPAGHSLLWSSDAGNGGSGPVTLTFAHSVAGAGALIQADLPGAFTGQIRVYNGATLLATYTVASDTAGDPVYLGALDQTGANISKVVFSLTACASLCTDFGLDTIKVNSVDRAALTSPTPGTVLAGPKATFTWTAESGASGYILKLGTTVGGSDIYSSGTTTATSITRSNLPTNGETIHARLTTEYGSNWVANDYVYTAATAAALTSPTPGTVLPGPKVTFTWSTAAGATGYVLNLGTTLGGSNLSTTGTTTSTSVTRSNIPTNGATIYARLFTEYGSNWVHTDYTFTAATQATMSTPSPGSTLTGSSVTFSWIAGTGATGYALRLGTTQGGHDLYGSGPITATSTTASGLPTNGETIYARLYTMFGSSQSYIDYVYTAQ